MSVFSRFAPRLQEAIVARLGWSSLRPVQEEAGVALLAGNNAVILAPTAGGKTEASMFPTLSGMVSDPPNGVGAIYIAPIKALLNNQAERLGTYTEMVGLDRFVWHGDTTSHARKKFLREPAELLMTTPESLEVMLVSQSVDAAALFSDLRYIVIDEVHAIAGQDRGAHLMSVMERLAKLSRHDIQRVGLSATVGNPTAILGWLQGGSKRGGVVVDPPKKLGRRDLLVAYRPDLPSLAANASAKAKGAKSLFFCQSRATTETVAEYMRRAKTTVFVHHSAVSKEERMLAEESFHHTTKGEGACIVCTSTLELGIDVGDLDNVLQAEAPDTVSSFLQRMGRTGRRDGKAANTTFLCQTEEGVLQAVALIALAKRGWVEDVPVLDRCWPVLVHQLFAMALGHDGIGVEDAWAHLSTLPDMRGITRAEFERLLAHLLKGRALILTSGVLVLGPTAERKFGRRNFMELYAVFSSPQSFAVETVNGRPLGTLNQGFVDRLVEGVSTFLLGGRAWLVFAVDHSKRRIRAQPAPRGRKPSWGGYLPQFLSFELCQAIREVLVGENEPSYLHESALAVLRERREVFAESIDGTGELDGVEATESGVRWWTFAGGKVNATIKLALAAARDDWKIVSDNFGLSVTLETGLTPNEFRGAIEPLRDVELWGDAVLWTEVAGQLPNYRLSKFQSVMPAWVQREMVADFLVDVEGAWRWLSGNAGGVSSIRGLLRDAIQATAESGDGAEVETGYEAEAVDYLKSMLPQRWVETPEELEALCTDLMGRTRIGLDVETTLRNKQLCLAQVATDDYVALIDVLAIADLGPFQAVMESESVTKLIHNARFERTVLAQLEIGLNNVVDTMEVSREVRGYNVEGKHSLAAVCWREFKQPLDKREQMSDWRRRPLTAQQLEYAALDAEILLRVEAKLRA